MIRAALVLFFAALLSACAPLGASPEGTSAGATAASPDAALLRDIAQASLGEIAAGLLAAKKAKSDTVRQYAQQMVEDHREILDQGKALASARQLPLPKGPDLKHQEAMRKLEVLKDEEFDRAYMEQMVQGHASTLQLLHRAASEAKDPALRNHAREAQPHIQAHLDIAKRIAAGFTGKAS